MSIPLVIVRMINHALTPLVKPVLLLHIPRAQALLLLLGPPAWSQETAQAREWGSA